MNIEEVLKTTGDFYKFVRDEVFPGAREVRIGEVSNGCFELAVITAEDRRLVRTWTKAPSASQIAKALEEMRRA